MYQSENPVFSDFGKGPVECVAYLMSNQITGIALARAIT